MTPLDQYLVLVTPVAFVIAAMSGVAFAMVIHHLRPDADSRLVTYLVATLACIWYPAQASAAWVDGFAPYSTLGRMTVFLLGFAVPMWAALRWLQGRDR